MTTRIQTIDRLKEYLYSAMQLEHATIPPYLTALYSIHPSTNSDARHILRVVVVEEMLHLTIAANLMNAVGGEPDLTTPGFVPSYPAYIPNGMQDFLIHLERFSKSAVETFLKIERPGEEKPEVPRIVKRKRPQQALGSCPGEEDAHYYSIGDFYEEIAAGFKYLEKKLGSETLFCGDLSRQVGPEYYYSAGGELHVVKDLDSALSAIDLIINQGEGFAGNIYAKDRELAHYYRFDQLKQGRYYQAKNPETGQPDEAHMPTGPTFEVNWNAAFPVKKDAKLSDYKGSEELYSAAVAFNTGYAQFLKTLTEAYNGKPQILMQAVPDMFRLRDGLLQLIHNPLPYSDGENAAPTFQIGES